MLEYTGTLILAEALLFSVILIIQSEGHYFEISHMVFILITPLIFLILFEITILLKFLANGITAVFSDYYRR